MVKLKKWPLGPGNSGIIVKVYQFQGDIVDDECTVIDVLANSGEMMICRNTDAYEVMNEGG